MRLRAERVDAIKSRTDSYVAAYFDPQPRTLFVGRVQDIISLQVGNLPLKLLRVLWFRQTRIDPELPGYVNVRVAGPGDLHEPDQLIEAPRIDAQVWLTDTRDAAWKRVHYKFSSSRTLTAEELDQLP